MRTALGLVRVLLLAYSFVALLTVLSVSHVMAQDDGVDPDDPTVVQPVLTNRNFENGTSPQLSPWVKAPATAPGIVAVQTCCGNHTPYGSRNLSISPQGQVISARQKVAVTSNTRYYLGAFALRDRNSGPRQALLYRKGVLCDSTSRKWNEDVQTNPNHDLISCDFVTGATQSNVVVKFTGDFASGGEIIADDFSLQKVPNKTTSRYVKTTNQSTWQTLGCDAASNGEAGVVILSFGHPAYSNPKYGVLLYPDNATFKSTNLMANVAIAWLTGYWSCGTGHVTLALGITNIENASGLPSGVVSALNYNHGVAWAQMVTDVDNWIVSHAYQSRLSVAGGLDAEADFGSYAATANWINGYASAYTQPYYFYGSCNGCPYTGHLNYVGGPGGWGLDQYIFAAYGATPALAMPQIYSTDGIHAEQWYRESLRRQLDPSVGQNIYFSGALTQAQACIDSPAWDCPGKKIDNSPGRGWGQLQHWLNLNPDTTQMPASLTDITWQPQ